MIPRLTRYRGWLLLPALLVALTLPATAQLGQTKEQMETKYGQPIKQSPGIPGVDQIAAYKDGDYVLTVFYIGDKNVMSAFAIASAQGTPSGKPLSDTQKQDILDANSGPGKWETYDPPKPDGTMWGRPDGAVGNYNPQMHLMAIALPEFRQAVEKAQGKPPTPPTPPAPAE